MGGRPNYICRCQSVVNNPESPPRPAPATLFHCSSFVSRISPASSVTARMLAQFMAWGWQQGEASSGSYFRRGLRVRATLLPRYNQPPLTAATYHLSNRSSPGDQSGGSLVIILVQEFTVFLPTTAAKELIIYLWLGYLHQKYYLYLKLSIVTILWVSNSEHSVLF